MRRSTTPLIDLTEHLASLHSSLTPRPRPTRWPYLLLLILAALILYRITP